MEWEGATWAATAAAWEDSGPTQGTLAGRVEVAAEASVPEPLCTDGTLRLRKGKGPARQRVCSQTELDVSSPAVRAAPPCSTRGAVRAGEGLAVSASPHWAHLCPEC